MSTFTIGPLVIGANGEGTPGWAYNNVKDWYTTKNDQLDMEPRPGQNGSFAPEESFESEATPTLEGVFFGNSPSEVAMAKLFLRSVRRAGQRVSAIWDDHGVVTQRDVFVVRSEPTHSAGRLGFKFAIDMRSNDAALYGPEVKAGPVGMVTPGEGGLRFDSYTGTVYEWEGATNASPTSLRENGVVTRRNLVSDPDTTALTRWAIPSADTSVVGGRIRIAPTGASTAYIYPIADPSVANGAARYAAGFEERITMRAQVFNTGTATTWVRAGIAYYTTAGAGSTTSPSTLGPMIQLAPGEGARVELASTMQNTDPNTTGFLPIVYIYGSATSATATSVNQIDTAQWTVERGTSAPTASPFSHFSGATPGTGVGPGLVFPETYGQVGNTGRLTIVNDGFEPAWSRFEFYGGSSGGFSISRVSTGESIEIVREIPRNSTVKVNPRTGRVSIDGDSNDISGSLRRDDWWSTPPQSNEQVQLAVFGTPYGSPTLTAWTKPTY